MSSLADVRERYRQLHGDHPTSAEDDRVLGRTHEPVSDEAVLAQMASGRLPMPPYLGSDGTPLAPSGYLDPVDRVGGPDGLRDWYVGYWPEADRAHAERAFADWMAGRHGWLQPATPGRLRQVERWRRQAVDAVELLRADPRDPDGRGSLGEALDGLDDALAPDTDVERSRRGGRTRREEWVAGPRRDHLDVAPPSLPIRTRRLLLRPVDLERDLDDIHAYYGREDVARYLLQEALSRVELADRMREWGGSRRVFGVVIELGGRVVGDVVLMFRGPSMAEIGWTVHPDVQGRGVATEASRALLRVGFEHYGLHRIYADLDARNTASARLCERLGMRRETHRLQDLWCKGEWTDTLQYGVLATEWEAAEAAARDPSSSATA